MRSLLRSLDEYYRPFYGVVATIVALTVATTFVDLVAPYFFGRIIDALAHEASFSVIVRYAVFALLGYVASILISTANERFQNERFDFELPRSIAKKANEHIFRFSIGQLTHENSAIKQSVVSQGENSIREALSIIVINLGPTLLRATIIVLVLLSLDPLLGVTLLLGVALEFGATIFLSNRYYPEIKRNHELKREEERRSAEALRYATLVKANGREREVVEALDASRRAFIDEMKGMWRRYILAATPRMIIPEFFRFLGILLGGWQAVTGAISPGQMVIYLTWAGTAFNGFGRIGFQYRSLLTHYERLTKYFAMLQVPPAVVEARSPKTLDPFKGSIAFEGVGFTYGKREGEARERHTLDDVTFTIAEGETVAIVGHSGAGKSTIVTLLLRGYDPDKGRIAIDGVDLRELALRPYLEKVGYVEQHVELFDDTLYANILFGVPEAKREEAKSRLAEALAASRIDQFLPRLGEKGLDTLIGEKGIRLSGGERQRVGIARALIKDPTLLIFDEATSSLDSENEALIHEAIKDALRGRTGIIIAHRLSTVRDADKIIVLSEGRVAAMGTHAELLERSPEYKNLVEHQLGRSAD